MCVHVCVSERQTRELHTYMSRSTVIKNGKEERKMYINYRQSVCVCVCVYGGGGVGVK